MGNVSDAAKRISDEYVLHRLADPYGSIGKWFAVALHDGTGDHILYDTKSDAVTHQKHNETYYAYIQVGPWPMKPGDAETFLDIQRRLHDRGLKMADRDHPNGGRDMIRRVANNDQVAQLRSMFTGDTPPTNIRYGAK